MSETTTGFRFIIGPVRYALLRDFLPHLRSASQHAQAQSYLLLLAIPEGNSIHAGLTLGGIYEALTGDANFFVMNGASFLTRVETGNDKGFRGLGSLYDNLLEERMERQRDGTVDVVKTVSMKEEEAAEASNAQGKRASKGKEAKPVPRSSVKPTHPTPHRSSGATLVSDDKEAGKKASVSKKNSLPVPKISAHDEDKSLGDEASPPKKRGFWMYSAIDPSVQLNSGGLPIEGKELETESARKTRLRAWGRIRGEHNSWEEISWEQIVEGVKILQKGPKGRK